MIALDELLFNALRDDDGIVQIVGSPANIVSTCFEVGPEDKDNTPLPCIIVTDEGIDNEPETKDSTWEGYEDHVTAGIEVDGRSPKEVKNLIIKCRKVVANYVDKMERQGEVIPCLNSVKTSQLSWDWMKPCYHQVLLYNCTMTNVAYE